MTELLSLSLTEVQLGHRHQSSRASLTRNISDITTTMSESESKFTEVQGGGSLILAWQIKGKKVLVIGGGEVT